MSCYGWGKNDSHQIVCSINEYRDDAKNEKNHSEGLSESRTISVPHKIVGLSNVVQVAAGTKHCVFLDRYGYVWTSGRNVEGQRGFIRKSNCVELQRVGGQLDKAVIVSVAAGGNMTFAISSTGSVYNWGLIPATEDEHGNSYWNTYNQNNKLMLISDGQNNSHTTNRTSAATMAESEKETHQNNKLMLVSDGQNNPHPTNRTSAGTMAESEKETYLQRVIKRSESAYYYNDPSLFNTSNFNATEGVTEFKVKLRKCFEPKKILSLEKYKCIKIACGCAHTLALAKDGTLLSRGYNDRGQLGNMTRINSPLFQKVEFSYNMSFKCIDMACGSDHNLALMSNGALFAFGAGALGQLGLGPKQKDTLQPKEILFFRNNRINIQQISCGQYHSVVIGNTASRRSKTSKKTLRQNIYSFWALRIRYTQHQRSWKVS